MLHRPLVVFLLTAAASTAAVVALSAAGGWLLNMALIAPAGAGAVIGVAHLAQAATSEQTDTPRPQTR
jgi:hypothetical protein